MRLLPWPSPASAIARLRRDRDRAQARRLDATGTGGPVDRLQFELIAAPHVRAGDLLLCLGGDIIAADGEVVGGAGVIDESGLVTGGAPMRGRGCDRAPVLGGSRVRSGWFVLHVTAAPGECLIDLPGTGRVGRPRE